MKNIKPDEAILKSLDFEYEPICEHHQHGNISNHPDLPARFLVRFIPCVCGRDLGTLIICPAPLAHTNIRCPAHQGGCGKFRGFASNVYNIIKVLG